MVDIINFGSDVFIKVIEMKLICLVIKIFVYEFCSSIWLDDNIDFFFFRVGFECKF